MDKERTNEPKEILIIAVAAALGITVGYIALGISALPERDGDMDLRVWYLRAGLILIAAWQLLAVFAALVLSFYCSRGFEDASVRRTIKGFIWSVCLLALIILSAGFFVYADSLPLERKNENGTLTVTEVSLGNVYHTLWKKEGVLARSYIRVSSADPDDIDPAVTEEEFQRSRAAREKEEAGTHDGHDASGSRDFHDGSGSGDASGSREFRDGSDSGDATGSRDFRDGSDTGDASGSWDYGDGSDTGDAYGSRDYSGESYDELYDETYDESYDEGYVSDQYLNDRINDGLVAIFTEEFASKQGYKYETSWSAKGEAGAVVYEDEAKVRFLRYDRQSDNEKCCLYVYYQAEKEEDGSYSPSDAKILDMYAYVIDSGEVISSGRRAWADAGTEEYRKAVNE